MRDRSLLSALARSFLAGEQAWKPVVARAYRTLGRRWAWLPPVARRYIDAFTGQAIPRHGDVVQFLRQDRGMVRALLYHAPRMAVHQWVSEPQRMHPAPAAAQWDIPAIESPGALADWLWLEQGELDWFADLKGLTSRANATRLSHYHYRILAKDSGSIRLIEAPKPRLKALQRQILEWILDRIPAHRAAHGFVQTRSIRTFAAPHTGKAVVLRMDLQDFFPSLIGSRIQTVFRTAGYPEPVADLLGGICTNAAPRHLLDGRRFAEARQLYTRPHLPQGAPTSPALANICGYRVDCRLAGLARSAGAEYTRYADDLAFSGGAQFERRVERFSTHAAAILAEEGFRVNHRKTRILRAGVRQHLAGLVTNARLNVRRTDFEVLKATLHNCVRLGPVSQNREGHPHFRLHLEGRVAFVESINPAKAQRLRALFRRIPWE